jgi:hypothetical protein
MVCYLSDVAIRKSHFSQRQMNGSDSGAFHVYDGGGRGPGQFFSKGRNVGRTHDRDPATRTENDRSSRSRCRPRPTWTPTVPFAVTDKKSEEKKICFERLILVQLQFPWQQFWIQFFLITILFNSSDLRPLQNNYFWTKS